MSWRIEEGDCLELAKSLPDNSMDCLVQDPPAGISFMGKSWDTDKGGRTEWVSWFTSVMREAYRVLKPGAWAIVWAIPRTSHWTAWAIEEAGFEIRDIIHHHYSTGMPKGLAIGKALKEHEESADWQGWNTSLAPSTEHWILARKPPSEKNLAQNVLRWGVGGLNIDACSVKRAEGDVPGWHKSGSKGSEGYQGSDTFKIRDMDPEEIQARCGDRGRWAKNAVLSHAEECSEESCAVGCAVAELDAQGGYSKSRRVVMPAGAETPGYGMHKREPGLRGHDDKGFISRFFPTFRYIPKPGRAERERGCEELPIRVMKRVNSGGLENEPRWAPIEVRNHHPTCKSIALMRWLVRLVCPPGGDCLDMFAGSGTTGVAAILEGMHFTGFEQDGEMVPVARARCQWAAEQPADEPAKPPRKAKPRNPEQMTLEV